MSPKELRNALGLPEGDTLIDGSATQTHPGGEPIDRTLLPIWSDLKQALAQGELTAEQILVAAEAGALQTLDRMDVAASFSGWPSQFLSDVLSGDLLDPTELTSLLQRLTPDLEVLAPSRVQPGEELFVVPVSRIQRLRDLRGGRPFRLEVAEVRQDGRSIRLEDFADSGARGGSSPLSASYRVRGVRLDDLGPVELEIDVVAVTGMTAVAGATGDEPDAVTETYSAVGGSHSEGGERVIPLRSLVHRVEVVDPERRAVQALADPTVAEVARRAIEVRDIRILPDVDGRSHVAEMVLSLRPIDPCALSFEVWAVPAGEGDSPGLASPHATSFGHITATERAFVGRSWAGIGVSPQPHQYTIRRWMPDQLAEADRIDLRFEPQDSRLIDARSATRRWVLPVVIENLPVTRSAGMGGPP